MILSAHFPDNRTLLSFFLFFLVTYSSIEAQSKRWEGMEKTVIWICEYLEQRHMTVRGDESV